MIIKFGTLVVGARGTAGGATFSANKSGPYVKTWARSSNPKAPRQQTQRANLSRLSDSWRNLTPAQQAAWDTWAALPAQQLTNPLGETYELSGFGWYCKINTRLLNIGRSIRSAVPTNSRPAAPTISSLQLPYLDGQTAKVVYPSGEFSPSLDIVIRPWSWISAGRQVAPSLPPVVFQSQTPGDTETGFPLAYFQRLHLAGPDMRGFVQVHRQTTDGLRSAAGTASFISSDSPAFSAAATAYNGTTDSYTHAGDLTGNADSKVGTFFCWFRITGGDGTTRRIAGGDGDRYAFRTDTSNRLVVSLSNSAGTVICDVRTTAAFTATGVWHSLLVSIDLANQSVRIFVDGSEEPLTVFTAPANDTIDWTLPNHHIGANAVAAQWWFGCLSQIFLDNTQAFDVDQPNALRAFLAPDGSPLDLGPEGNFPLGSQPIIAVNNGNPTTNQGSGGNYVALGGTGACGTTP